MPYKAGTGTVAATAGLAGAVTLTITSAGFGGFCAPNTYRPPEIVAKVPVWKPLLTERLPSGAGAAGFESEYRCIPLAAVELSRRFLERSEEHTSELQSQSNLVCRLLLEKKKQQ